MGKIVTMDLLWAALFFPPLHEPHLRVDRAPMKQVILAGLAVLLLVGCGKKKEYSAPSLLQQLKDANPKVRYYAARELGHFGAQAGEVVPALIEALKDADKEVRMRVAYSLAEIGPDAK